uniref:Ribosomal protein S10 domain-containing protein n=1 Tax=Callorhinchus milii TaxID=7868 RepID=A0A4W3J671_CALMI
VKGAVQFPTKHLRIVKRVCPCSLKNKTWGKFPHRMEKEIVTIHRDSMLCLQIKSIGIFPGDMVEIYISDV